MVRHWLVAGLLGLAFGAFPTRAGAERARYRYVPTDNRPDMTLQPAGGERQSYLGAVRRPDELPPRPTHILRFIHPISRQSVAVPVALPRSSPRIEYGYRRVTYNYGSFSVAIVFLADGSVEVLYNSGLLRAL